MQLDSSRRDAKIDAICRSIKPFGAELWLKNHEKHHFDVSDLKYRCCTPLKSSRRVKIPLGSKFQPWKFIA